MGRESSHSGYVGFQSLRAGGPPQLTTPRKGATHWSRWLVALTVALGASAGCYAYVPGDLQTVPLGSTVRVELSPTAARSLDLRVGIRGGTLSGRLIENQSQRVLFLVRGPRSGAIGEAPLYQRVDFVPADVLRVDRRVLNKPRTVGLLAVLLGAATITLVNSLGGGSGGSQPPPNVPVE